MATEVGRVILLNGAPSTGKTTIARALWEALEPPHWYRSWDDFRQGYLPRHLDSARGQWSRIHERQLFQMLSDGYRAAIRAMALVGHNVISESIILPANVDKYLTALDGIPVFLVGVRCPLDVAEQRERARAAAERYRGEPIDLRVPEFELVHSHGAYDLEIDTSVCSVAEAVATITRTLARPPSPSAFDVIRAERRTSPATSGMPSLFPFELSTERLRLRDYVPADAVAVQLFAGDPEVVAHLPFGPNELIDTEAFIRRAMASARATPRRSYEVALTDRTTGELVGGIRLGVQSEIHREASLGYILRRDRWGRGLMTEAPSALAEFGFRQLELHRIWATCAVDNIGSMRVLEKIGMRLEGHLREHISVRGQWRSSYLYAVLKDDLHR